MLLRTLALSPAPLDANKALNGNGRVVGVEPHSLKTRDFGRMRGDNIKRKAAPSQYHHHFLLERALH